MTQDEIEQIQARCDAATPGPWKLGYNRTSVLAPNGYFITEYDTADDGATEDAAFIAASREDIPKLLAALREAEEEIGSALNRLQEAHNERDALRAQLDEAKRAALGDVTANVELAKGTRALRAEVEQEGQRIEEYAGCRIAAWLKENDK